MEFSFKIFKKLMDMESATENISFREHANWIGFYLIHRENAKNRLSTWSCLGNKHKTSHGLLKKQQQRTVK